MQNHARGEKNNKKQTPHIHGKWWIPKWMIYNGCFILEILLKMILNPQNG
jgi:hypothetical protein